MVDHTKNMMIGVFVIAAATLIAFILLFIHPTVGDDGRSLKVRFANIDKVTVGTRVTFGGRAVGEVIEIREILGEEDPRPVHNGIVYPYELTLTLDSSVEVFNSDEIALRTSGLLGERSVNIRPQPPREGEPLILLTSKDIIFADESGGVEETLKEFKELSDKFEEALDGIISTLNAVKDNAVIENIGETFANLGEITSTLNQPEKLDNTLNSVEAFTKNLETITEDVIDLWPEIEETVAEFKGSAKTLNATMDHAFVLAGDARQIVHDISLGRGTLGRVLVGDELYLQLSSLLAKGETLMNDVNHYGILFHLDKNWQRLRARRLNLLMKLCTPQEFRNFFNDEIDQIATSLSRVTMVLDETGTCTMNPCLIQNLEFNKVFSELLRRIGEVEEYLKMYNTQLNDFRVLETELDPCGNSCFCQ